MTSSERLCSEDCGGGLTHYNYWTRLRISIRRPVLKQNFQNARLSRSISLATVTFYERDVETKVVRNLIKNIFGGYTFFPWRRCFRVIRRRYEIWTRLSIVMAAVLFIKPVLFFGNIAKNVCWGWGAFFGGGDYVPGGLCGRWRLWAGLWTINTYIILNKSNIIHFLHELLLEKAESR